ncbi:glucan ABC transporter ATP-binding protein/ permease [Pararhizobium mangrovi]|uniref:glucan ABC transporter ATP-binding protein/ permease n=1 Tax=Pararhizobium mangrovi TaxID=2590452 RepID=UPI0015E85349|nr:glucan ABC transporter ATP-binding protein/ permease [Pararhizobium mangrovi]
MSLVQVYLRALRYLATHRMRVGLVTTANVILAVIMIAEPVLFGRIIDALSGNGNVALNMVLWGVLGLFSTVAFVLVAREADRLAHRRRVEVLTESFSRVISMPLSWHGRRGTSNALHTLLRAVDSLSSLWLEFMRQHLATAVAIGLLIPTAISMDFRLSLVLLMLGIVYFATSRLVIKKTKKGQAAVEQHHHRVFSHVSDAISNVSVLHSYNRIDQETRQLGEYTKSLISVQFPVLDWWALASGMHRMASTISMLIILIVGAVLVGRGEIMVGDVVAFIGFANLLISRLDQISQFVNQIFDARSKLEDFYRLEDAVAERSEPEGAGTLEKVSGNVRFENVHFTFDEAGSCGVHGVDFEAKAGETVAIVGPTGAGKTTLMNLLQRVFDPQSGRILIDGVDIASVTRRSLRSSIATVFQDSGLLNRSIAENIRLGRDDASHDEVAAAAEAAAATDFIGAKNEGFDTTVGERGGHLSGGERQRIAIARAVLKNAPILVLDEATSALDVETEERVKNAIDTLRRGRTTFVIAHRLSTVREADRVLFVDHGRIIESGSFQELRQSNGRFAALLRAGGVLTDDDVRRSRVPEREAA